MKKKAVFFRQLATLVNAGIPLGGATQTAGTQAAPELTRRMSDMVGNGIKLSDSMRAHPYYFSEYEISMVDTGESAGNLDVQLNDLAHSVEYGWQLRQQIQSKMAYPIFVLHAAVFIPPLFLLITKGPAAYLALVLGMLIPSYLAAITLALTYRLCSLGSGLRKLMDSIIVHIPILGQPFMTMAKVRIMDVLAKLIGAGLLPDHAVPLAARACGNRWVGDQLLMAHQRLGVGNPLSVTLRSSNLFTPIELSMVSTGEETGDMSALLLKVAEHLQLDFKTQSHRLMTILPVVLLFLVGGVVGMIVINMMANVISPLMNI